MATLPRLSLCVLAALALTACGDPTPEETPAAPATTTPATPTPDPKPAPKPEPEATIPAAFQGVWAATAADCNRPAETRLEIHADRLRFYESSGPVASVETISANEIIVVLPLTGEGATSQRSFRYRLLGDGDRLFDVRNGLERARCPAA